MNCTCSCHTGGEEYCEQCCDGEAERAREIIIKQIESSTGPTGGWLDSPKAVCAAILIAIDQQGGPQ